MTTAAIKPKEAVEVQSSHKDKLSELYDRRRALADEIQSVVSTLHKIENTPREEADIRAEIGSLDAKERAAAQVWAEQGANGEPPAVDVKGRAALNTKLAGAVAKSAASEAAVDALRNKQIQLSTSLSALNLPISTAANHVLIDMLEAEVNEAKGLIHRLVPLMASIDAGRLVIVEENHRITALGQGHGAQDLFRRLETITGTADMMRGDPAPNLFGEWTQVLEELKAGE
ncbi:hypothetical protein HB779_02070 [Phyllobacterium sp. 628]|uniref:hypothetical protein n=1 Tax=Phyllobacterium sp. 628 TaxID=2718938 RepID=UPI0016622F2F|nr:hypothetical protein [Phyllobacterium sp. 628]QND50808.1 hypothetical protein HB779_02070 [Phyllobacterium sp. 628]